MNEGMKMSSNILQKLNHQMGRKLRILITGIFILTILSACQAAAGGVVPGVTAGNGFPGSSTDMQTRIASGQGFGGPGSNATAIATATETPAPTSTPLPVATTVSQTDLAIQAAQDYSAALQKGDFGAASKSVSAFSLLAGKMTAGDVVTALTEDKQKGAAWSDFKFDNAQVLTDNTILVHVTYQLASVDSKTGATAQTTQDEQWPFRLENKQWLYNWGNIIDFKTLSATAKLINGLTVTPLQLTRYSDKIRLTVLAQNSTNESIVIGQANQVLATFHFADKSVDAVTTRYILDGWRSYPNVTIDVMGLFTTYPDSVELIKYKTTTAAPWFTFAFSD
jgi:hypothetical protein